MREPRKLIPPVAIGTPLVRKEKCPRRPAATITTLTAATFGVLTGFMGSHPADLGHPEPTRGPIRGQRTGGAARWAFFEAQPGMDPPSNRADRCPMNIARYPPLDLGTRGEAVASRLLERARWTIREGRVSTGLSRD